MSSDRIANELTTRLGAKMASLGSPPNLSEEDITKLLRECVLESQREDAHKAAASAARAMGRGDMSSVLRSDGIRTEEEGAPPTPPITPPTPPPPPQRDVPEYELLFGSPYDNALITAPDGSPDRRDRSEWRRELDRLKERAAEADRILQPTATSPQHQRRPVAPPPPIWGHSSPKIRGPPAEAPVVADNRASGVRRARLSSEELRCAPEVLVFRDAFAVVGVRGVKVTLESHVSGSIGGGPSSSPYGGSGEDALTVSLLSVEQVVDPSLPTHMYDVPLIEEDVDMLRMALNATLAPHAGISRSEADVYDFNTDRSPSSRHDHDSYASQLTPLVAAMSLGRTSSRSSPQARSEQSPARSAGRHHVQSAVYLDGRLPLYLPNGVAMEADMLAFVQFCLELGMARHSHQY